MTKSACIDQTFGEGALARDFVIASQPIFSKKMDVFAHELLFRKCSDDDVAVISNFNDATNQIIADGFALATKRLGPAGRVTVNVGSGNILSGNVMALPAGRAILEIPSDAKPTGKFLSACKEIKDKGYSFLLDNYGPKSSGLEELVPLMDYIKVPVSGLDGKGVAKVRKAFPGWEGKLVASRIETWEEFEGCKFLGFDYFQGFFFSYPQEIVGRRLSSHKAARLNLLRVLSDENADFSRIVGIISTDQALSVRLLHFVNSAAFSRGNRVDSLERAASLVGVNSLKKWAMTAALSDLDTSGKGSELSYRTMHGALFLGLLADNCNGMCLERETLSLLGLLSKVDALMGLKMKEVVEDMPLLPTIKSALLRDAREPMSRFVMLLDAIWRNDWNGARSLLNGVGVPLSLGAKLYMQAGEQTQELIDSLEGTA